MKQGDNFVQIGDYRDIPMSLGLIVMIWNRCEETIREMLRVLASKGQFDHLMVVTPLIVELGSVGLAQAVNCYADELPDSEKELAASIRHAMAILEVCRAYRNYYIHGISGVSAYGIHYSNDSVERELPLHEIMTVGPYGKIYAKSAKGKQKFILDFIDHQSLVSFNNYLADFDEYLHVIDEVIRDFFRKKAPSKRTQLPKPLPMLGVLKKPVLDHPKLKLPPALRHREPRRRKKSDELPPEQEG